MACRRCGGFIIVEVTSPFLEDSAQSDFQRIRCLNCGNVEDTVIFTNRLAPRSIHEATRHNIICPEVEHNSVKPTERRILDGSTRRCA